jgi:type IV pilus assembly protein PilE
MMRKFGSGFSLIELMVVIAILAILVSIGYPIYTTYVEKTRRAAARGVLLEGAQYLDIFYNRSAGAPDYTQYVLTNGNTIAVGDSLGDFAADMATNQVLNYYNITVSAITPTTYTLQAALQGGYTDSAGCNTQTLNQLGVRTTNNPGNKCDW